MNEVDPPRYSRAVMAKEDWRRICARRMTATLARRPRSAKSRAYVGSLPRRAPIVVRPEEFSPPPAPSVLVDAASPPLPAAPSARRDRRRPLACGADPAFSGSPWACRPSGFRLVGFDPSARTVRVLLDSETAATVRTMLRRAQDGFCGLCGRDLDEHGTFDHVVPIAGGGVDALGNLLLAHSLCNERKSNDVPTGCEAIWLLAVNARIGVGPTRF